MFNKIISLCSIVSAATAAAYYEHPAVGHGLVPLDGGLPLEHVGYPGPVLGAPLEHVGYPVPVLAAPLHDVTPHYNDLGDDHGDLSHPQYEFQYSVSDPHTGDHKSQHESRDGDAVHGFYSLVQPDGSVRKVEYTADDIHGFQAVVHTSEPLIHVDPVPVYHQAY